ncbi:class I SAM-dependent methyltransferase [Limnothrix sp. FACHB-708]|uniref:class I SAM-dependent methyltransferase n=1 Tax=unclassified Limnothrix TaxID=2632864 RepID=UPI001682B4FC|nr:MULTISPECIES: class I SAM-dependent methyltransferase [unclassified Limnothrix]MBD2553712.1 class I SAM-dependent methyltransferase [Limnothrix sp. FACHB-708]MBD2591183.1 class I SAM-dependent methyltransferase [Limnothrix sp. FACHB-406]
MSPRTLDLSDRLYDYLLAVSLREAPILQELRQVTARHPAAQMQIAPEQGQFMALLVQLIGAERAIEVGTFTGYSTLSVALAMPDRGRIVACDVSANDTAIAQEFWQRAGVAHKIDLRIAPALETLDQLLADGQADCFDFAFIDADKKNYPNYLDRCLALVRPGGLIAIDNVLWAGRVADPTNQENNTEAIREFNARLHQDPRVDLSLVPIGDGMTLARRRPSPNLAS